MFKSLRKLAMLALPVLSAGVALSLPSTLSAAETSAESALRSGRATELITPEAVTVRSTANYQVLLPLTCDGATLCQGDIPAVGARRRLKLTRVSCYMTTSTYSKFSVGQLHLLAGTNTTYGVIQILPVDHTTDWGHHSLNRAVDVQVTPGQYIRVKLFVASGGQTTGGLCTAHGTLEVLG